MIPFVSKNVMNTDNINRVHVLDLWLVYTTKFLPH